MLANILLVAFGSAVGGSARYGLAQLINAIWKEPFPLAIFIINLMGSFVIGLLASTITTLPDEHAQTIKHTLMIGVCGGFTTFSSFSLDTLNLIRSGQTGIAALYVAASVILCVIGTACGAALIKH